MKALVGALAIASAVGAAPALAASDYLLEIEGIKGESRSMVVPGAIDILSWSWGLSSSALPIAGVPPTGKVSLQDLHWTQPVNAYVPPLLTWITTSPPAARDVTLHVVEVGGAAAPYEYFQIYYPDSLMSSLALGGSSGDSGAMVQASVAVLSAQMKYRKSASAPWVTGGFTIQNNALSFSGDATVLEGYARALAAPVPEPSTWALMLAGVLFTGLAARRRARS